MKTSLFACAALCAAPLFAAYPGATMPAEPLPLSADEMDQVTAGNASVTSTIDDAGLKVDFRKVGKGKKVIFIITKEGQKQVKKVVFLGDGDSTDHFAIDGKKVVIKKTGAKCIVTVDSAKTRINIADTPSGTTAFSKSKGRESQNSGSSSSSSSSSSSLR